MENQSCKNNKYRHPTTIHSRSKTLNEELLNTSYKMARDIINQDKLDMVYDEMFGDKYTFNEAELARVLHSKSSEHNIEYIDDKEYRRISKTSHGDVNNDKGKIDNNNKQSIPSPVLITFEDVLKQSINTILDDDSKNRNLINIQDIFNEDEEKYKDELYTYITSMFSFDLIKELISKHYNETKTYLRDNQYDIRNEMISSEYENRSDE